MVWNLLLQIGEQFDVLGRRVVGHGLAGGAQRIIEHVETPGRQDVREPGRLQSMAAVHRRLGKESEGTQEADIAPVAQLRRGFTHHHRDK